MVVSWDDKDIRKLPHNDRIIKLEEILKPLASSHTQSDKTEPVVKKDDKKHGNSQMRAVQKRCTNTNHLVKIR